MRGVLITASLLLTTAAFADGSETDFQAALSAATAAEQQAGALKNQWTVTEDALAAALGAARVWGVRSEQRPREQLADRAAASNPLQQFGERTVNRRNGSVVCACLVASFRFNHLTSGRARGTTHVTRRDQSPHHPMRAALLTAR